MLAWPLVLLGGVVSGVASNFVDYFVAYVSHLLLFGSRMGIVFFVGPGICFGVLFLIVLKSFQKLSQDVWKWIVFILISIVAYNAAYWSAFYSVAFFPSQGCGFGPCQGELYGGIFIGGVVGALFFILGAKLLFRVFSLGQLLTLLIISGILGVIGFSLGPLTGSPDSGLTVLGARVGSYLSLYVVWQTGMIGMMYYFLKSANSITNNGQQ